MRFYDLTVGGFHISSQKNGNNDPGALDLEIDIPYSYMDQPIGYATVRLWGVPLHQQGGFPGIDKATDLNNQHLVLKAGMAKGLPLATRAATTQQGTILQGKVFQAFGNWIDTAMTIDLVVATDLGATSDNPANLVVNWQQGQPMKNALQTAISTAYPDADLTIDISDKLVLTETETAVYNTLEELGTYCFQQSKDIIKDDNYQGVRIAVIGNTITVQDQTVSAQETKQINFADMIGQPTWFSFNQIQANFVMRGDLNVNTSIQFPQGIPSVSTAGELASQAKDKSAFSGKFNLSMVRHVGRFRQPDAASWITTVNAYPSMM